METGPDKTAALPASGKFPGREQDENLSVGLAFGSGFFSVWQYADKFGEDCIGELRIPKGEKNLTEHMRREGPLPVFALSFSPAFSLLPRGFFEETEIATALELTTAYSAERPAEFDRLPEADAVVVYEDSDGAQDVLDRIMPGLKLHHGAGHLLRVLTAVSTGGAECFLFARDKVYFIFVLSEGAPLLANSLTAENTSDIVYFTLFALKQTLPVPAAEVKTILLGDAAARDDLREALAAYIRNVDNTLSPASVDTSGNPDPKSFARYIIGYTAKLCA